MAVTTNKMFLDKTGLTTLWGIITNKFATKSETITSVDIVPANDKATLIFTYADNTAENSNKIEKVINPVNASNAGLMTPTMLTQLEAAVGGTIGNLKLYYNSTSKKLQLFDGEVTNGKVLTEIDATAFIKDGMLSSAELVVNPDGQADGTYLKLVWNTDAGTEYKDPMYINVTDLIDVYTAGDGIAINGKEISCTYRYTLPVASDSELGGIKIGYTDNNDARKYAVKLDNEKAYVSVPWENTKYSNTVQTDNLVKLELKDTAFSIDESALTTRLSGIDTTVKTKVESVAKATDEALIEVSTTDTATGKAVEIKSANKLTTAVGLAEKSIQGVEVLDADKNIISISKDENNNVTLSAGTDLDTAMANANYAVQTVKIGDLTFTKADGIASVTHDGFVGHFAMTKEDIEAICK